MNVAVINNCHQGDINNSGIYMVYTNSRTVSRTNFSSTILEGENISPVQFFINANRKNYFENISPVQLGI